MKKRKGARKTGATKRKPTRLSSPAVTLPAECMIASADELKSSLLKLLPKKAAVTIDATAVQRIDTAGLQVLAAFVRERQSAGLPFTWKGVGEALNEAAQLLDLGRTLGLDSHSETVPA